MAPTAPVVAGNAKIQRLRRLIGRRSSRYDEGVVVVEGPNALAALLENLSPPVVETVYVGQDANQRLTDLADRLEAVGATRVTAAVGVLPKVLSSEHAQPLAAVVSWAPTVLVDVLVEAENGCAPLLLVLDRIADPGNLGTIIRSAAAAGVHGVVLTEGSVDPGNPKVVRSSAGALFALPIVLAGPLSEVLQPLHRAGIEVLALRGDASTSIDDVDLLGPIAFLLGNEAHGLTGGLNHEPPASPVLGVLIPMAAGVESLNVAMAATIAVFECSRQRRAR